ncbi:YhfC family intramembrane metalloprotease [Neobacillus mesonae]|uniref:YhfC family intramembrane metalloprotease n=1 Tax=Neobacillus mesonae TaxID=1193713 RepID=A0A3Q9QUL7_9BACI|nr:YhfC family glutamic-type intramembrane protease [Neobacillus mesonae]AZU62646.1 hypothetical protein CHR53_16005 [Neobacillus mesonae]
MVSTATIVSMFIPIIFSFALFVGLILFYRKRTGIAVKPLILGAVGFIVFTQILEKVLHFVVVVNFPNYADHPWLFGLYGAMAAGIFEEFGRFLLFIWLLKKFHDYKGGISFGVGWGGIEAILLMLMMIVPNILFAIMINSGTLETEMAGKMPADQLTAIKDTVLSQGVSYYLLGTVERFFAVFIQIALSLLVLTGVVKKKFSFVILAVMIHAVIDFPFIFVQTGYLKLWMVEPYLVVVGILCMLYIKRARNVLPDNSPN